MKLPPIWSPNQGSGYWWHNQEKGGLIMRQTSHFHEMPVDKAVTYGHQAKTLAIKYSLRAQE
jgi:hypothetical protein